MGRQEGMIPAERQVNIFETSRRLRKSERTIRRWYHKGKLKGQLGQDGHLYFDADQIDEILSATPITTPLSERVQQLENRVRVLEEEVASLRANTTPGSR